LKFQPFTEAREYLVSLEPKSKTQWRHYCKSIDLRRIYIPSNSHSSYKKVDEALSSSGRPTNHAQINETEENRDGGNAFKKIIKRCT